MCRLVVRNRMGKQGLRLEYRCTHRHNVDPEFLTNDKGSRCASSVDCTCEWYEHAHPHDSIIPNKLTCTEHSCFPIPWLSVGSRELARERSASIQAAQACTSSRACRLRVHAGYTTCYLLLAHRHTRIQSKR